MTGKKFLRLAPNDRRGKLIEATIRCVRREGREGLTTRKISAEAGISNGLVFHHFDHKEDLIAAAYTTMADRQFDALKKAADTAGQDAQLRLKNFVGAFFGPAVMDRDLMRAWVAFWSLSFEFSQIRLIHDRNDLMFREYLAPLLVDARGSKDFDPRLHAIELNALLDGLWVEWCLDSKPFDVDEGRGICERWIDRFLST